jgi:acetylserotonin N-methyltransferase
MSSENVRSSISDQSTEVGASLGARDAQSPEDLNQILHLIEAFRASKALFVAVSVGVFDRLAHGEATLKELAADLNCQIDPMERLLDACVGLHLLGKTGDLYRNQEVASIYLNRSSPTTLVGYILYSNEVLYPLWGHLEKAVKHGGHQWKQISREEGGIFDQFFQTDEAMHTFLKGMHGFGLLSSPAVVSAFDLSMFHTFVDVGGATGHLAVAACERYPKMKGIVFDLPSVIDAVAQDISRSPVSPRIQMVAGNMFSSEQIPEADVFALGRILHDWTDDKAKTLLRGLHAKLRNGGGILLAEKLLAVDKSGPSSAHLQSLNMLVCTEGKERTLEEYRTILQDCGFVDVRGHVTGTPLDAVFATKA